MSGWQNILCKILYLVLVLAFTNGSPLGEFIEHYETLDYKLDIESVAKTKRSTSSRQHPQRFYAASDTIRLEFVAFGRNIKLILQRDPLTVSTKIVDGNNRRIHLDNEDYVAVIGKVENEPGSIVYGSLTKKRVFLGRVYSPKHGMYFVEPAHTYFEKPTEFHSIIYRGETVLDHRRASEANLAKTHHSDGHGRFTRATASSQYERNICSLSIEVDDRLLRRAGGLPEAVHLVRSHVAALNAIFRESFNTSGTYAPHGIKFIISRIKIYVNASERAKVLGEQDLDSMAFLLMMTDKGKYDSYCQAIFFTNQPFENRVLGKAFTGTACDYRNTAVVSFRRGNMEIPAKITEIIFAHEVAHLFDAKHDPLECQPSSKVAGTFIMHGPGITSVSKNNYLFSPCSMKTMKEFINLKRNYPQRQVCFETYEEFEKKGRLCGNGMVEDGEECDCGDEYTCKNMEPGNCCNPKTCKLDKHAQCSPSNGLCCDGVSCTLKRTGAVCLKESECLQNSTCPGNSSLCPDRVPKQNLILCNRNTSLCLNGTCSLSICVKFNLDGCSCEKQKDKCKTCCEYKGKCEAADSITEIKSKINVYNATYMLDGSLCDDGRGYCDGLHICHKIRIIGPIRYLLSKEGVREITHHFWWAIFLGTLAWLGIIVLLVKYGALYVESSNPLINQTSPARPLSFRMSSRKKNDEQQQDMIHVEESSSSHQVT